MKKKIAIITIIAINNVIFKTVHIKLNIVPPYLAR